MADPCLSVFLACDESDPSRIFTINWLHEPVADGAPPPPWAESHGLRTRYGGLEVERLEKGRYRLRVTGLIVVSDDPWAP